MKTKTQFMNRILSLVLSIMMVVSMLPMNIMTSSAAETTESAIDLSTLTETYLISDSGEYTFTGSGSYGIKVESGNPTIVLNNASITVGKGSAIDVASGSNATIFVMGDNTVDTDSEWGRAGGIFVAEGGTVNITSNSNANILRAHGTLAAAIGGKYDYDESYNAGNINISNVTVYAYTNNFYASAIGAAGEGTCGTINITNAVVYAYGAGDKWSSAPGIGSAWGLVGWPETIPVVIISGSEIHTFRYNPYSDYIGYLGDESGDTYATGSINCGEGGSVTNSTIYCYTGLTATTTDKVVKYGALGGLLKEDGTCEGEHSGGTATCKEQAICGNCGASYGELLDHNWKKGECTYGCNTQHDPHDWESGICNVCGLVCAHTGGTATCTTLAVCDICKTAYGELGGHTYNTAGSCTVCDYVCPHSNFDSATGNCKDCEISLAIAKVETGGNTIYYQTADELSTAIENNSADQAITLLANFEVIRDLCFYAGEAKNTLDLNGHTLTGSSRIDVEYGELTITGTGSINIFMTADNKGAKIVVGSGVTLNDTLRSVYGGVLDLTNATIPEAGLNVILYSDDSDPTTYNVSDVLLLPADYYFFMDGKAVYTYSGKTEGTVLKHAEHNYTYTDNGDGTHDATCSVCGKMVDNEAHTLTYTANGNTIAAACSANCGYSGTATISATGKTYDGNAVEVVVSKTGSLENMIIPVTLTKDSEAFTGEPVNAGAYTASVTLGDKTVSVNFTIAKAEVSITTAPTPNTLTYIGEAQYLISAGEAVGGTMVYSLTENGEYTTSIPQGTNAGDYTVWYYVQGDANHNDSAKDYVSVTIEKATPTAEDFVFAAPTDLIYDGTAKPAAITVKNGIVGMGEVNIIYFRDAGMWIDNEREPIYPGRYKVGIWIKEGDNYKAVYSDERIWLGSEFEIKYLTTDAKAVISGTVGSNGWYTSDVTLTAPEGYQISKTKYNDGFVSELTFSAEQNETITYYLKDANGDVAEKTVELKIDKTAPSAQYQIGTDGWKQFINTITFGLFCKDYKTVDIEYTDDLSGVAEKQYYIASEEITNTSRIAWLDYTDTLSLNATGKYFIYMRVVDNAGNEVILNTEGIVIYEDSVQVTESVSATYNAGTDKAVTVKLNGNTVNAIQNGNAVLTAGTDYTVSADGTITLKASYLDALKAGEYTFTVSYNPQGVETDKVNMTTAFTVKVEKADGKVSNLNISGKTYDGTAVTAPTFDKPGDGAATIEYKVKGTDDSTYTTTAPKDAGDYIVRVTVAEGTNHKAASATAEFTIDKAAITVTIQNATSVYGDTLAELKATDNGIVNGDANVYSLATTAAGTSNVGKYTITGAALDSNYDVTFVNGEYEITKREITITVDAKNAVVNTTLPTYTYKAEGLVGVDTLVTEPTLTCNANIALIGEYDITATGADAGGNYSIKYVPAKLTVLTDNAVDAAAGYTEELKDYDPATVTSEDKAELDEMLSGINTILADETTTDNGKKALEEVKEQVEKLIKEITDAAEATDTENTVKVENVTPENVTPENKNDLEGAKADLEKALEDNGGNYTEDEKKAIEAEIKRIDDALEVIGNVEAVEKVISKLPAVDTVEPDDEEAIKAITDAQTAYNALSDYEKSLVDEATKVTLDKLAAALVAYDIVEGDGSSWTEDSDHNITFVVNGLFGKFVGIKVDGKDVDKANYEVKAGSTIITLKASYLDTLAVGEHTITVVYTDGSTDGAFNVHAKANSPATGDNSNMFLWIALLFISGGAVITLTVVDRKRRSAANK